jgi:hypothetical protein
LRGGALIRNRHGAGGSALGDGAFVTVGLGKGGGGLDARGATLRNRLGHRGSGHGGSRTGAHLGASRAEDDHVAVVSPRCLRQAARRDRGHQRAGGELGRPADDSTAGRH